MRRKILLTALVVLLPIYCLAAPPAVSTPVEAIFTSVTGKIEIRGHKGHMIRLAKKNTAVGENERIVTGSDAQATLKIFDGSELKISPNTDFWVDNLKKPNPNDKIIKLKLRLGQLLAKVTKLFSAKSAFEIEAGGVVCGVRGTRFSVSYDPTHKGVHLHVYEGTVYTDVNGKFQFYNPGQDLNFEGGILLNVPGGGSSTGGNGNGSSGGGNGNGSTTGGNGNGTPGNPALNDLTGQFGSGLIINGQNNLNDPGVEGGGRLNIKINVKP